MRTFPPEAKPKESGLQRAVATIQMACLVSLTHSETLSDSPVGSVVASLAPPVSNSVLFYFLSVPALDLSPGRKHCPGNGNSRPLGSLWLPPRMHVAGVQKARSRALTIRLTAEVIPAVRASQRPRNRKGSFGDPKGHRAEGAITGVRLADALDLHPLDDSECRGLARPRTGRTRWSASALGRRGASPPGEYLSDVGTAYRAHRIGNVGVP